MNTLERLGKEPIGGTEPAGTEIRYDACFDALQDEIDKLSSPLARESFSWQRVAELSTGILKERSKDLLVASYLCVALVHLNGLDGLGIATGIYADLLEGYWATLFPPLQRMGGRHSALRWWLEKTEEAIGTGRKEGPDAATVQRILANVGRIGKVVREEAALDLPFGSLIRKIEQMAPSPDVAPEAATGPGEATHGERVPVPSDEVTLDPGNLLKSMAPLLKTIKLASRMAREERTHDPQPYRWLRFALWEPVRELPPAANGGTKVPPPSPQVLAQLKTLREDEAWAELLAHSEGYLYNPAHTFLLSLNFFTAEALSRLGKKHARAREIVERETLLFVHRLPGVETLRFSDGTPFASDETLAWLARMSQAPEAHDGVGAESTPGRDGVEEEIQRARALAREEGRFYDAVEGLHQRMNACGSGKEALLLRLGLIRLLADHTQELIAVPHLEQAYGDILRFDLVRWDPDLALGGLKVIYHVLKRVPGKEHEARLAELLSRIAQMDTVEAIKLQKAR